MTYVYHHTYAAHWWRPQVRSYQMAQESAPTLTLNDLALAQMAAQLAIAWWKNQHDLRSPLGSG